MISLETGKKLQEAGLIWEPNMGDFAYNIQDPNKPTVLTQVDVDFYQEAKDAQAKGFIYFSEHIIWLPRLDQLLSEIEKRGFRYSLNVSEGEYFTVIGKRKYGGLVNKTFQADSPEEATTEALLWILEQEVRP